MALQCYEVQEAHSGKPVCGIHQEPLFKRDLEPSLSNPPGLGHLFELICPVTGDFIRIVAEGL